ncbi:MAG: aspartate carbamoyltransferase regulatory subunit [Paludibacteraceae bacterium]|nr:aspartate carbamoyltransferase regulatory subunit [Candidatus Physcocola equi]MCQ2233513.1 aspartate carbamoyltransferase regulatory subunit [Paludibacteraceae bacterium]
MENTEDKKEMKVAKLCNGTVIDHIPSDKLFKVIALLDLEESKNQITFGYNLDSKKVGKKAIIKITDRFLKSEEVNKVALLAPNAKIVIIRNYEVAEKILLTFPDEILGDVKCLNPKCITNNEPMKTRFRCIDKAHGLFMCHYCERVVSTEEIVLNK